MGDPLNLLSVAVPTRYMAYFYSFLVVLRLYLAGLAFSGYCFYMGRKKNLAVLTGALCYVFCGYALFGAIRHPFFLNPMIYFPLILTGVEKKSGTAGTVCRTGSIQQFLFLLYAGCIYCYLCIDSCGCML